MDLAAKMEEYGNAIVEFRKTNDARLKAIEEKKYAPAELEEKTTKLEAACAKIEDEVKQFQTSINRLMQNGGGGGGNTEDEAKATLFKEYHEAQINWMRKNEPIPAELCKRMKTYSVDSDESGGFFVSPQLSTEIVKKVYEMSPIRQLASTITISTDSLDQNYDLGELESGWVGETEPRTSTGTDKLKQQNIPVHEMWAMPDTTQKFLDDAAVNVEGWLTGKVADKFARDETHAFLRGNGVKKPSGILSFINGQSAFGDIEQVPSAATVITGDDIIDLVYSLKEYYAPNATFLMRRTAKATFRKLKDAQGQYLWGPGLNGDLTPTLLGYPVREAPELDLPGTPGKIPVIFGDIRAGYQIVDRIGIRTLRDPLTKKGFVLFYTTKRVGGSVKDFDAIKLLRVS